MSEFQFEPRMSARQKTQNRTTASYRPTVIPGRLQTYLKKEELKLLLSQNSSRITTVQNATGRSNIWNYFKRIALDNIPQPYARCNFCFSVVTYSSQQGTGSLIRHKCMKAAGSVSRLHAASSSSPVPLKVETSLLEDSDRIGISSESSFSSSTATATRVDRVKSDTSVTPPPLQSHIPESRLQLLAYSQVAFVAKGLLPLNIVDNPGFLELAQALIDFGADFGHVSSHGVLVDSQKMSQVHLPSSCKGLKEDIIPALRKHDCAFSVDVWYDVTPERHKFVTVMAHFIDDDFRLSSVVLKTQRIYDTDDDGSGNTVMNIVQEYVDVGAKVGSSVFVTTAAAFGQLPSFQNLNRVRCVCELLNQVLDPILKDTENSEYSEFRGLVENIRKLIVNIELSELGVHLDKPLHYKCSASRWNSTHEMLNSVREAYPTLKQLMSGGTEDRFLDAIGSSLEDIVLFLSLFKECSQSLCNDSDPTLNECVLWKLKLEHHCLSVNASPSPVIQEIRSSILENLNRVFVFEPLHYVALFLDPNFKSLKMLSEDDRKVTIECVSQMMREVAGIHSSNDISDNRDLEEESSSEPTEPKTTKRSISKFQEFLEKHEDGDQADNELRRYIGNCVSSDRARDILYFWKTSGLEFPLLQRLARRVLAIPATSASEERLFGQYGTVVGRRSMLGSNIHQLLFLNHNLHL